jgi:heme exporter protein A
MICQCREASLSLGRFEETRRMSAALRLNGDNLGCIRGERKIFSNLSFSVSNGEALAVVGPNGSGKSSLLRLIAGLVAIASGTLKLTGGDDRLTLAEQTHLLGHRDAIKPSLSVIENVAFWFEFLGGDTGKASPAAALEAVGLSHLSDLPTAFLSAGQRRRLAIARLVALKRPVWLLDEPTTALDAAGQATIAALMTDHLRAGRIIVAATHQPLGIAARELRLGAAA